MSKAWPYIRDLRPLNLLITLLCLWVIRLFLLEPYLHLLHEKPALNRWQFALLAVSVLLIMAGGYIINDCQDIPIDRLKKNARISVYARHGERGENIALVATGLGLLAGGALALHLGAISRVLILFIGAALLWFYNTYGSRVKELGNIIIALLVGLVLWVPLLYEPKVFALADTYPVWSGAILYAVLGFSAVAAWTTLLREIAKDAEDIEADKQGGRSSWPIRLGLSRLRLLMVPGVLLFVPGLFALNANWTIVGLDTRSNAVAWACFLYLSFCIAVAYIATTPKNYTWLQRLLKGLLLIGLLLFVILNL